MLHNSGLGWVAGVLAGAAISLGQAAMAQAGPAAPQAQPRACDCDSPYREYKPAEQAKFKVIGRKVFEPETVYG